MQTTTTGQTYAIDPSHSEIGFSVAHLMIAKIRGNFTGFSGSITLGGNGDIPTAIDGSVDVASIHTREEKRDAHLKSPDFFDAENFPSITFASTSITGSGTEFSVTGNLTIHGTTNAVTLKGEVGGRTVDPWGNDRVAYSATGKIDRTAFGIAFAAPHGTGLMIGNDVTITLEVEAVLPK
jgi:polyisoprenoid-binding protein YceI